MSLRFERSIEEYFQTRKNLEYLNLEINEPKVVSWNDISFYCFENRHQHELFSDQKQLNSVVDLAFTNLRNTNCVYDQLKLLSKVSIKKFHRILEKFEFLGTDLASQHPQRIDDRVANLTLQIEDLSRQFEKLVNKGPLTKKDLESFTLQTLQQSKEVETRAIKLVEDTKLQIEELKELLQTVKKLISG